MDILPLLDELRVMAQAGLCWANNPYDRERYERILELISEYYNKSIGIPPEEAHERLSQELGYVTPNIGVKAAIFDDDGRMLLMQRPDEPIAGTWDIPGGAVEPFEAPATTATRETREETGLDTMTISIVDAYFMEPNSINPHGHILLLYLSKVISGTLQLSHEGDALQYWEIEEVPEWALDFHGPALDAREIWENTDDL